MVKIEVNLILFAYLSLFIISVCANKYVVSNQRVTFHEAHSRCRQYGLDLAEILSESDEKEIEQALLPIKDLGTFDGFWIFASNLADKKNYYWLNSNLPLFYSAFYQGQPFIKFNPITQARKNIAWSYIKHQRGFSHGMITLAI
ncbi:C-type lectin mosGCTL-7-like isoform X1 [Rhynchophorus ferrugineus]|uniref:C-type lectin mosGCTL-7-like isoform X1 n=1 Tax=Rhynchophorus ferrugineus TaxID=354439 RepID=UPI003FCCB991